MKPILELIGKGGPTMIAIISLSVILYSRCFKFFFALRRARATQARLKQQHAFDAVRRSQRELRESFRQQRVALGSMIAAAPLLGLLGTVSGMVKTFEGLAQRGSEKSMESLAQGISEVLVSTESGLMVALPALLFVYLVHREVNQHIRALNQVTPTYWEKAAP